MAISSEIEKLERRWNENPSGLMFAPLAEAYRKAGNHVRALEILEHGLRVHPDYVPALIVRGRCQLEIGGVEEALAAFDQALTRDPVNPIALRGLAEVHERAGRPREAVERLELLLEVDRGDAEARAALERLRAQVSLAVEAPQAAGEAPAGPDAVEAEAQPLMTDEPPAAADLEPSPELTFQPEEAPVDLVLETSVDAEPDGLQVENLSIDPISPPDASMGGADVRMPWEPVSGIDAPAEPAQSVEEPLAAEPVAMVEEALVTEPASSPLPLPVLEVGSEQGEATEPEVPTVAAEAPPEPESVAGSIASEAASLSVWTPQPEPVLWTPAPTASPLDAVEPEAPAAVASVPELAELAAVSEPQAMETQEFPSSSAEPAPPESPEAAALDWPSIEPPVEPETPAPEAVAEPAAIAEPTAGATEEPELIVTESMAEVFVRQGHPALALAVYRQLAERSPESESIHEAIRRLEAETTPPVESAPEPAPAAYRASDTGGRSVGQLLRSVLQAPPPVAASTVLPPAIEPPGEPARASQEPLSLGAVFGDEPIAPPPAAAEPQGGAEPSYDEFFGAAPTADVSASGAARDPEGEDLRQFNDWLRGLKR